MLLSQLGDAIDVILRMNYRSVIACQQMKEALEHTYSGVLFLLLGGETKGMNQIRSDESDFEKALRVEFDNITLLRDGRVDVATEAAASPECTISASSTASLFLFRTEAQLFPWKAHS